MPPDIKDTRPNMAEGGLGEGGTQAVGREVNPPSDRAEKEAKQENDEDWTPLSSDWCRSCRYLSEEKILEVSFKSGHIERYQGVSEDTANALKTSGSPGKFIWRHWPPHKGK